MGSGGKALAHILSVKYVARFPFVVESCSVPEHIGCTLNMVFKKRD